MTWHDGGQIQSWVEEDLHVLTSHMTVQRQRSLTFALTAVWTAPAGATAAAVLVLAPEAGAGACAMPT